jgi:hypothetical protein
MGRPDVDSFLDEMTAEQWAEWQEYFDLEPWDTSMAVAVNTWVQSQYAELQLAATRGDAPPSVGDPDTIDRYLPGKKTSTTRRRTRDTTQDAIALLAASVPMGKVV